MARSKDRKAPVKIKTLIIIPTLLASLLVVALIVFFSIILKEQNAEKYQTDLTLLTVEFEKSELSFYELQEQIINQGKPVSNFELDILQNKFEEMNSTLANYNADPSIANIISLRITDLQILTRINSTIRIEDKINSQVESFQVCQGDIGYNATRATQVERELKECTAYLNEALLHSSGLPSYLFTSFCSVSHTPENIIQKLATNHSLLIEYYSLLRAKKGPEAAEVDKSYQKALKKFKGLPKWNGCVTEYLQIQTGLLSSIKDSSEE